MKATCARRSLFEGLQVVGNVVSTSVTKQILSDIKIEVLGEEIELCGTDLEVGLRYRVRGASAEETGALVVPSGIITDILRTAPDEKLTLCVDGTDMIIEGKDSYFRVHGEDPAQFPSIPDFPEGDCLEIEKADLLAMISRTVFATAQERTRYALNGVLTALDGNRCMMVSTDGRRLAMVRRKCKNVANYALQVIVPTKALTQIQKIVTEEDEHVRIRMDENQILVQTSRSTLYAQLIEGQFPDYETVVPSESKMVIELPAAELESAVSRAGLLATEESKAVKMAFTRDMLTLTSRDPEEGEAKVEMPVKYEDEEFTITFNPDYVADVLKAIDGEIVKLKLNEPDQAAVLTDSDDFTYVIMPLGVD